MSAIDPALRGGAAACTQPPCLAAAIVVDGSCDADALLARVAQRQQAAGRQVRGLLMRPRAAGECAAEMVLTDLQTGEAYLVSQPRGTAATGCRADLQGFAHASQVLRRAQDEAPDLVISNRFGGLEALGKGFRAELLALMCCGLPLLTAVVPKHLEAWREFTGMQAELPAELGAIEAWIDAVLARVRAAPGRGVDDDDGALRRLASWRTPR